MKNFWEAFSIIFIFSLTLFFVLGTVIVGVWMAATISRVFGILFVLIAIPAVLAAGFCSIYNIIDQL